MLDFLLQKDSKKSFTGIDIGLNAIRLISLTRLSSGLQITGFRKIPIPDGIIDRGTIRDNDAIIALLKQAHANIDINDAVIAVPANSVLTKVVEINKNLSDLAVEEQVWVEAIDIISQKNEEMSLDYYTIGPSEADKTKNEVMVVACRTENVNTRTQAASAAGFNIHICDVDCFALANACQYIFKNEGKDAKKMTLVVFNIDLPVLTLVVVHEGIVVYTRESEIEMKQIMAQSTEDIDQTEVLPVKMLIAQMQRSLQFFYSASESYNIDQIVLTGDDVSLTHDGLLTRIEEKIGIKAMIANPFVDMQIAKGLQKEELEKATPSLMTCFGLALRGFNYD